VWAIVLPIALGVGVIGFIVSMYVSGMRSFANTGLFGGFMAFGMIGMLFRGRDAAQRRRWRACFDSWPEPRVWGPFGDRTL
jgi:S-DNA-T family DNA segregation ATPase FtsK/SpoIIIE